MHFIFVTYRVNTEHALEKKPSEWVSRYKTGWLNRSVVVNVCIEGRLLCLFSKIMPRCSRSCRPLIHIFGRLHLTLHDADDAAKVALLDSETSNFLVVPRLSNGEQREEEEFNPASLTEIFQFNEMICRVERKYPSQKLVLCAGRSQLLQAQAAFLVGCHMIMSRGTDLEETYVVLERLHGVFERVSRSNSFGISLRSCLSAVYTAKERHWIDFQERFTSPPATSQSIQMDEYMHYARWYPASICALPTAS